METIPHDRGELISRRNDQQMIDNFSILLSHGLLMFVFWLLTRSKDLDQESPPALDAEPDGFGVRRKAPMISQGEALRRSRRTKSPIASAPSSTTVSDTGDA
jgi:hypothetical protein